MMALEQQFIRFHDKRVRVTYQSPMMRDPNTVSGRALRPTPEQLRGGTAFFLELEPGSESHHIRIAADWILACEEAPWPPWRQRESATPAPGEPWLS